MTSRFTKQHQTPSDAQLWLYVRDGEKDTYFELAGRSRDDVGLLIGSTVESQAPDSDVLADVISFSPLEDLELRAQKRETSPALTKRLMAEVGVQLVSWRQVLEGAGPKKNTKAQLFGLNITKSTSDESNNSGQPRGLVNSEWLYATPTDRMATTSHKTNIWPGRAILRSMLAQAWTEHQQPESPYVTGVVFTGSLQTVVVFFKANETGDLDSMVSVNLTNATIGSPEERETADQQRLEQALKNYLQHVRLASFESAGDFPSDRVCLFSSVEFVQQIALSKGKTHLRPYPVQQEIFGIGVSTWWKIAMQLSALTLLGVVATSLYAGVSIHLAKNQFTDETQALGSINEQLKTETINRWGSITQQGSVAIDRAILIAQELRKDGLRTEIDADRELIRIKVIAKVVDPSNTPSAMTDLLSIAAPEGCVRLNPQTNIQLSELYITYECTSVYSGLSSLLTGSR